MSYGKALHYIEADVHGEEGKIGTVTIGFSLGKAFRPAHTYFVCPDCGVMWGKIILKPDRKARHFPINSTCSRHGGGVFSTRLDKQGIDTFPLEYSHEVLLQDFLVMYDWVTGLTAPEVEKEVATEEDWTWNVNAGDKKPWMLP